MRVVGLSLVLLACLPCVLSQELRLEGLGGSGLRTTNEVHSVAVGGSGGSGAVLLLEMDEVPLLTVEVLWGSGNGFTDLTGIATAAHVHGPTAEQSLNAATSPLSLFENHGVLFNLNIMNGGSATNGGASGQFQLTAAQAADLLAGKYYINVHTAANPAGEIRGNMLRTATVLRRYKVMGLEGAGLLPGNEVAQPAITGGTGDADFLLHDELRNNLAWDINWGSANGFVDLTGPVTAAHIHGPTINDSPLSFSQNAGVSINLVNLASQFDASATSGSCRGQVQLPGLNFPRLILGAFYINVHTAANPGGEMRGQIIPQETVITRFQLMGLEGPGMLGANSAPNAVVGGGSGGINPLVRILYDDRNNRMSWGIQWGSANGFSDLTGTVTALHIHGPTDSVSPLSFSEVAGVHINFPLASIDTSPSSGGGRGDFTPENVTEFMSGRMYFNVHTAANPPGEMRGQILRQDTVIRRFRLMGRAGPGLLAGNENPSANSVASGDVDPSVRLLHDSLTTNFAFGLEWGSNRNPSFSNLTGPVTVAHIHGPTDDFSPLSFAQNAGVFSNIVTEGFDGGASGGHKDQVPIDGQNLAALMNGRFYFNIHTATNPAGEIRAQILPLQTVITRFRLLGRGGSGLLPSNELTLLAPEVAGSGGESAVLGLLHDSTNNNLAFSLGWGSTSGFVDLSGPVVAAHIHGITEQAAPESFEVNAGVLIDIPLAIVNANPVNGGVLGQVLLSEDQVLALMTGRLYFNFHTGRNPGGEIRANIVRLDFDATLPCIPQLVCVSSFLENFHFTHQNDAGSAALRVALDSSDECQFLNR